MPPKKLNKAEKDRLKQEAERKTAEEEEQRLREEEEKRKGEEEERKIEAEKKEKIQAEEQARFDEEISKYVQIEERLNESIQEWLKREKENKEWNHYISCNPLPYPTDERALNTYLSMFRESTKQLMMKECLTRTKDLLILQYDLEGMSQSQDEEAKPTKQYIDQVHHLIHKELDKTTLLAMESSNKYIDSETFNLIIEEQISSSLTYCLWGNIVKNPRLKDFSFQYREFTLELPKSMLLADVAVRVVYPPFDTLTPQCKTYLCPVTAREGGDSITEEEVESEKEKDVESIASVSRSVSRIGSTKSETNSVKEKIEIEDNGGEEVETQDGEVKEKEGEEIITKEDEVDMRSCTVVSGSPILMSLLVLPPQPKYANNWTIRQSTIDTLVTAPDLIEPSGTPSSISITMNLPDPYFYPDDEEGLQLAQWDEDNTTWRLGRLKEVKFDLTSRSVSFVMNKFSPLAVLIDTYINLPYQSWELLPLGINHTLLHIVGSSVEVAIEIKMSESKLVRPLQNSAVEALIDQTFSTPGVLMKALTNLGLHFFPAKDAHKYTSLTDKDGQLEASVYKHMAMTCGGWSFQWSQWNEKGGDKGVVLQASACTEKDWETLQDDPNPDNVESWKLYLSRCDKTVQLKMLETDADYSDTPSAGHETHSELYTALLTDSSLTSQLVSQTNPVHIHTVNQWLTATRPLVATC